MVFPYVEVYHLQPVQNQGITGWCLSLSRILSTLSPGAGSWQLENDPHPPVARTRSAAKLSSLHTTDTLASKIGSQTTQASESRAVTTERSLLRQRNRQIDEANCSGSRMQGRWFPIVGWAARIISNYKEFKFQCTADISTLSTERLKQRQGWIPSWFGLLISRGGGNSVSAIGLIPVSCPFF